MKQPLIAQLLEEHAKAIQRHQQYVEVHEAIMQVLHAFEQQVVTEAQAIAQLEKGAASQEELGLAALYRQTIERLRR